MTNAIVQTGKCEWCGDAHKGICWKVKAIEYFENGAVKRVEFELPKHIHERPYVPMPLPERKSRLDELRG